ncbi:tRNA pseudouridine synthase [Zea mays]|uniref:tRNA pseudouridine synthase n=3 Tax=Zea mays TaxID=4577 RepID=A0A1D6MYK1_MAIZE|nr:tRNA pseudouridine synthase [Zea mays]ONM33777.1 tRNA pseudouridine synthase [Zea mays]ONM33781.1 tRNA pseudouridine synthase [Zea mays]
MTDRNPAAASSKRHCDLSLDDPTPSAKLQRCSEPSEPTPAGKPNGGAATGEESEMMAGARNPRAQRYLVAVEYIGTRFSGSQKQPNQRTVTGVLEEAFHRFIGQPVSIIFSSRTSGMILADSSKQTSKCSKVCDGDNAGVKTIIKRRSSQNVDVVEDLAAGATAETSRCSLGVWIDVFWWESCLLTPHEPGVVKRAVNHFLLKSEGDIMVTDVCCVAPDFHARYKSLERTYHYRLLAGPESTSVFEKNSVWHISEDLDIQSMKKACSILVGHHDFSSFRAAGCQANSPVRTLDELSVTEVFPFMFFPSSVERSELELSNVSLVYSRKPDMESSGKGSDGSCTSSVKSDFENGKDFGKRSRHRCFVVTARARSFLYHQVRLMVGLLKSVGTGDLTTADVERILDAKTVTAAPSMAPSCGLYLANVKYDLNT